MQIEIKDLAFERSKRLLKLENINCLVKTVSLISQFLPFICKFSFKNFAYETTKLTETYLSVTRRTVTDSRVIPYLQVQQKYCLKHKSD